MQSLVNSRNHGYRCLINDTFDYAFLLNCYYGVAKYILDFRRKDLIKVDKKLKMPSNENAPSIEFCIVV